MARKVLPWEKEYRIFGVPKSFKPYPDKPAYDILYTAARKYKKSGLMQMGLSMTYPEAKDHVDRMATAFHKMGLKKGDRVATLLPTSIQFIIADYAISRAGLVHMCSSPLEPADHLSHKFKESNPQALICMDTDSDVVKGILQKSKIKNIIVSKLEDYSAHKPKSYEPLKIKNAAWWTDLIADTAANPPELKFDVEKDLELLLFTGGSTGMPKGCMLTHRNVYANAIQNSWAMGAAKKLLEGNVSVLMGLPFFHSYGHSLMHTMSLLGFQLLLVPDARDTSSMVKLIKENYPFMQVGVPTQFLKLTQEELKDITIIGISGSAPLSPTVQEEFDKKSSGGGIMEGYGLSEMSPVTHFNPSLLIRIFGGKTMVRISNILINLPGYAALNNRLLRLIPIKTLGKTIGKGLSLLSKISGNKKSKDIKAKKEKRGTIGLPFPDTEMKILDVDSGKTLSWDEILQGKTGELCMKGPQRMLGYWPKPGSGLDEEGYVRTGDVVKVDQNGYYYIVDRTKDMIIVSGFKVYSREIDDILHEHPAVERAATVGIPDPERQGSERVIVFIEPRQNQAKNINEAKIVEYLKAKVAKYAVPKKVFFLDSMPLTAVQKVDKKVLREMAEKKLRAQ